MDNNLFDAHPWVELYITAAFLHANLEEGENVFV